MNESSVCVWLTHVSRELLVSSTSHFTCVLSRALKWCSVDFDTCSVPKHLGLTVTSSVAAAAGTHQGERHSRSHSWKLILQFELHWALSERGGSSLCSLCSSSGAESGLSPAAAQLLQVTVTIKNKQVWSQHHHTLNNQPDPHRRVQNGSCTGFSRF